VEEAKSGPIALGNFAESILMTNSPKEAIYEIRSVAPRALVVICAKP
jgi:hypothetical protein